MTEIAYGLCHCGCGGLAPISPVSHARWGYVKGHPRRFIRGHTQRKSMRYVEVDLGHETPCHISTKRPKANGYVNETAPDGRTRGAHILAWEAVNGSVPEGLELDHLCRNKACRNPAHLEAVTHAENVRRGNAGVPQSSKTHCPKGHPYAGENLYTPPGDKSHRVCRECRRATTRRHRAKKALAT